MLLYRGRRGVVNVCSIVITTQFIICTECILPTPPMVNDDYSFSKDIVENVFSKYVGI